MSKSMGSYAWLIFALGTVVTWGLYGIFLHAGQVAMSPPGQPDPNARYKAFLFVGIAYFITAVLAPLAILIANKSDWSFPAKGMWLSLFAGILGAIGAFFVLLALGALFAQGNKSAPAIVMSIIFAGAPVVNAIVAMALHPPAGGISAIRWPFALGLLMAAMGGFLVARFKPEPAKPEKKKEVAAAVSTVESARDRDPFARQ